MKFQTKSISGQSRLGHLSTIHSEIPTPVFMPVGTRGSVKTISHEELETFDSKLILGNTYHLYLRPGHNIIGKLGGLHGFTGWKGSYLTDSGGYQVFSLQSLNNIDDGGVSFQSHIDGSKHRFTPTGVVDIQIALGADIMMPLDVCSPYPITEIIAENDKERTIKWVNESFDHFRKSGNQGRQSLFAILQGSIYENQRLSCLESILKLNPPGIAIGGLSVGEPKEDRQRILEFILPHIPKELPRYLMGVGTPEDILEAVELGVDMFDCVMPTRNARNGTLFTRYGKIIIKSARYIEDENPVDPQCGCPACRRYSRAFIRHLLSVGEILGLRLATLHNLYFYLDMMKQIRNSIENDKFKEFKAGFMANLSRGVEEIA